MGSGISKFANEEQVPAAKATGRRHASYPFLRFQGPSTNAATNQGKGNKAAAQSSTTPKSQRNQTRAAKNQAAATDSRGQKVSKAAHAHIEQDGEARK
eukprot:2133499-Rhodomonas_salina.1